MTPRQSRLWLTFGAIAAALVLILGVWALRTVRRLNGEVAQLNNRVRSAEQQSQELNQEASQAALSARLAALQRDQAKDSEAVSAAQAQSALQEADTAKQQASQAE